MIKMFLFRLTRIGEFPQTLDGALHSFPSGGNFSISISFKIWPFICSGLVQFSMGSSVILSNRSRKEASSSLYLNGDASHPQSHRLPDIFKIRNLGRNHSPWRIVKLFADKSRISRLFMSFKPIVIYAIPRQGWN